LVWHSTVITSTYASSYTSWNCIQICFPCLQLGIQTFPIILTAYKEFTFMHLSCSLDLKLLFPVQSVWRSFKQSVQIKPSTNFTQFFFSEHSVFGISLIFCNTVAMKLVLGFEHCSDHNSREHF
jgi:hypothetical protein